MSNPDRSIRLVQAVRSHLQKKVMYKGSLSGFQVPLHVILTNLRSCYGIWRKQGILGALDIQNYEMWVREFGEAWVEINPVVTLDGCTFYRHCKEALHYPFVFFYPH